MGKLLKIIICLVIVSFFFYPTPYSFTYGYNTKQLIAVLGIFLYLADLYRQNKFAISNEFLGLIVYSLLISLMAIFSASFHNTQERAYTNYIISMLVWISAAYVVIKTIKFTHGTVSITLVAAYIIAVSCFHGLVAMIADNYPPLDNFILRIVPGIDWVKSEGRLYGLSGMATLDSGGIRFGVASVLCAHNIKTIIAKNKTVTVPLYILAFLILSVTGNMIARTTIVGTALGLAYLLISLSPFKKSLSSSVLKTWIWLIMEILAVVILVVGLYNSDEKFRRRTRFGFEGFFSLVEEGHWRTGSNDVLESMYVFPDNPETWLIGDGYFVIPGSDPNYMGESTEGYYKGTDVGYLRFIFFFGLIGLAIFSLYIIYAGRVCIRMLPGNTLLFLILTAMNFIVWLKVATDCFFVLCLFICLGYVKNNLEVEGEIEESQEVQEQA